LSIPSEANNGLFFVFGFFNIIIYFHYFPIIHIDSLLVLNIYRVINYNDRFCINVVVVCDKKYFRNDRTASPRVFVVCEETRFCEIQRMTTSCKAYDRYYFSVKITRYKWNNVVLERFREGSRLPPHISVGFTMMLFIYLSMSFAVNGWFSSRGNIRTYPFSSSTKQPFFDFLVVFLYVKFQPLLDGPC